MKRILIILAAILVLGGVGVAAYLLWPQQEVPPGPGPTFPTSGNEPGGFDTITIPVQGDTSVETRDFLDNGVTVEDPANKGTYYLAGETGYCYDNGFCPRGAETDTFNVVYFSADSAFVISLRKEPLGEARREAEEFLMGTLGLSQQQLCSLTYYVGTDSYTSAQFAGKNLGFSFCSGATKLP